MSKSNFKEIPFEKGPKYIASTATIRNSSMQIKRMYGKKTAIFLLYFLQDNDSFFTKLDDSLSTSRLYCGLMGKDSLQQFLFHG